MNIIVTDLTAEQTEALQAAMDESNAERARANVQLSAQGQPTLEIFADLARYLQVNEEWWVTATVERYVAKKVAAEKVLAEKLRLGLPVTAEEKAAAQARLDAAPVV